MSKFCGNCGAPLEEGAKVCGQCGTPVPGAVVKTAGTAGKSTKAGKSKLPLIIAAVAVVLVAAIAISFISGFTGPKGLAKKVMKAYGNYDIDALVDMASEAYFYNGMNTAEFAFRATVGAALDSIESQLGSSYKFSYKIEEVEKLSQRKTEEIIKQINAMYPGFNVDDVKKISSVSVAVTAKKGSDTVERNVTITMTYENGEWRLFSVG